MNSFDIFILVVVTLSMGYSAWRGLVREVFSILSIGLGYMVALNFQDNVAEWMSGTIGNQTLVHMLAYAILFALTYLTVFFIGKLAKKYIQKSEAVTRADRIWGGVLGLFKGVLIVVIILFPLQFFEDTYENLTDESFFRPYLEDLTVFLGDNIDVQRGYLEDLNEMDLKEKLENFGDNLEDLEGNLDDTLEEGVEGLRDLEDNLEGQIGKGRKTIDALIEQTETIQEDVTSQDRKKLEEMLRKMDKK